METINYEIIKLSQNKIKVIYTLHKEGIEVPFVKTKIVNLPKHCSYESDPHIISTSPKEFIALVPVLHKQSRKKISLILTSRKMNYRFIKLENHKSFIDDIDLNLSYIPTVKFSNICITKSKRMTIGVLKIVKNKLVGFYLEKDNDKKWLLSVRHITLGDNFSKFKISGSKISGI